MTKFQPQSVTLFSTSSFSPLQKPSRESLNNNCLPAFHFCTYGMSRINVLQKESIEQTGAMVQQAKLMLGTLTSRIRMLTPDLATLLLIQLPVIVPRKQQMMVQVLVPVYSRGLQFLARNRGSWY